MRMIWHLMCAPDDCDRYLFIFLYIICYYIFLSLNTTAEFTKITTNNTIYSLWFIDCLRYSCSSTIPRYCLLSNTYTNIDCSELIPRTDLVRKCTVNIQNGLYCVPFRTQFKSRQRRNVTFYPSEDFVNVR